MMSAISSESAKSPSGAGDKSEASEYIRLDGTTEEDQPSTEASESDQGQPTSVNDDGEPPLPNEEPPPLPNEPPPSKSEDDGWEPVWDENAQGYYFYNRLSQKTQWENPRVPEAAQPVPPGIGNHDRIATDTEEPTTKPVAGGYDPAIHGDYDPNADYAKVYQSASQEDTAGVVPGTEPSASYAATGAFNRFTGKWQNSELNPDRFNDENKSKRQMNAFFNVDAAANSHDGRSLKAERSGKKLSKKEIKAFKDKRRDRKEEKRRAWLRD